MISRNQTRDRVAFVMTELMIDRRSFVSATHTFVDWIAAAHRHAARDFDDASATRRVVSALATSTAGVIDAQTATLRIADMILEPYLTAPEPRISS